MIRILFPLFMLCLPWMVVSQVSFQAGDLEAIARAERDRTMARTIVPESTPMAPYDVTWYRCRWTVDPAIRAIAGNVTVAWLPVQNVPDSIVLHLTQELQVDSVTYHAGPAVWNHAAGLLSVRIPPTMPPVAADSLTVYYHGVPPESGFGSFATGEHSGTPVMWTLSEPYGAAEWWPCKNDLTDKADSIDIFIQTPAGYRAVSNGILAGVSDQGNQRVFHWKHRYPIAAYLVCMAVTNYSVFSQEVVFGADTLEVVNYIYPEDSATVFPQVAALAPAIKLFDSLFGIYPFQSEQYGHCQFGWGGGMEHQTMTFVGSFGFELLTHELAHQWFGDKITCGSWEDIWLNEGFATYLSGLCYEFLDPVWWPRFREVRIQSIVSDPGGSVWCDDTTSVSRIFSGRLSYAKGAMVLHQLRKIMGDDSFFTAIRNYITDPGLAYGFARTPDLKGHLEAACGCDLTGYFNDWFTGQGYPSYHVNWSQQDNAVSVRLGQTRSHPSVDFFEMPVPLLFRGSSEDSLIWVNHTFDGEIFTIILPFAVDTILVDPGFELITASNTVSGISPGDEPGHLAVYPNPTTDEFTITFPFSSTGNVSVKLYNSHGRFIRELMNKEVHPGLITETFQPGLTPGIYMLQLLTGQTIQLVKVVVY